MAPYTPERAQEIADNLTGVQSKMEETLRSITNAQKVSKRGSSIRPLVYVA